MTLPDFLLPLADELRDALATAWSSPRQLVAYAFAALAVGFVVAGALTRTMLPLRWLAVASNVGLVIFGALKPSPIPLLTAGALLPINLWRAVEVLRLSRRVAQAGVASEMTALWLRPYMKRRRLKAGQTLFARGDKADRLYLLADGQMELVDIGVRMEPGRIFGEIALFTAHKQRTQTARCISDCTVLQIHASTVRQLYFQNPAFAFHLVELLAERLSSDVERLRAQVERRP